MISVITPAYNCEKYIEYAIKSVREQSFSDWEMIIVDDCSSDNTFEKAKEAAKGDKRIKIIRHEKNMGAAAARNTALDNSSGEYVAFLDSDDMWERDKLKKQYGFMEKNGYVLTYSEYKVCDPDGNIKKCVEVPDKMTVEDIYKNTVIACLTVMVNRKAAGDFRMPVIPHTEDQCTWQDILKRGYIAYGIHEPLAIYRESGVSLTGNKIKAAARQWQTYRKHYGFSVFKSAYYFTFYAVNAIIKHSKK